MPIIEADGPTVFAEKDRYGYMNGANCVLPPQFLAAESFVAGYAIAATSTGKGLLKIIKEPFQCQLTKTEYKDGMENTEHTAVIPTEPKDAVLKMKCVDSTGMKFEDKGKKKGGNMLFALSTFRERRTFTVESTNSKGTLVLWSSVYNQSQDKETPVPTNKKTKAKKNKKSKRK
ncbi:MAG: hypothetical protein HUK05_04905 [Prevotella sp.]|nr:hypothetical protein [Prevotella sp.]